MYDYCHIMIGDKPFCSASIPLAVYQAILKKAKEIRDSKGTLFVCCQHINKQSADALAKICIDAYKSAGIEANIEVKQGLCPEHIKK